MAIISKDELVAMTNMPKKRIWDETKRGNLIVTDDDKIDTLLPKNIAFIKKMSAKYADKPLQPPSPTTTLSEEVTEFVRNANYDNMLSDDDEAEEKMASMLQKGLDAQKNKRMAEFGIMTLEESEQMKKHYDAISARSISELNQLKIDKINGIYVPTKYIEPVIKSYVQTVMTAFKNACEDMVIQYGKILDAKPEQVAEMRGHIITITNDAVVKAADMAEKSVEFIVNDFSQKRAMDK